jgi:hypothetical protein
MPSAPFGCSVFDLGRVGTYRNSVRNSRYMQLRGTYPQLARRQITAKERQTRAPLFLTRPSRRRCYLTPELDIAAI